MKNKIRLKQYIISTFIVSICLFVLFLALNIYEYKTYTNNFNNKIGAIISVIKDKYPEITDKEAQAIATYIAYIVKFKEGLTKNNGDLLKLASVLEGRWHKQCDQARVKQLSQNDFDAILEVGSSWDRKRFGFGYKPLR